MTDVVVGLADQNMLADLTAILDELEDYSVKGVATTTEELVALTQGQRAEVVLVHEDIAVEPIAEVIRDLAGRRPDIAILEVSAARTANTVIKALESGARGVVAYPFSYEDVSSRLELSVEWVTHVRRFQAGISTSARQRGHVLAVAGAKGGVGTTTVATHLAQDQVRTHPESRVCLVDVDVEKGDVGALLDVRQAVSIADVAKVAADLSTQIVLDAVILHETGMHVLLAPSDVREADFVTPEALRAIVEILRREFDVVILDAGGHVSPSQAAAVEIADEVLVVTTADVMSVRAMRRRMLAWTALGVGDEAELRVLVNKVDKSSIFPASAVGKLTTAHVTRTTIPLSARLLENAQNERDPRAVTEVAWWRLMSELRREVGLERAIETTVVAPSSRRARAKRRKEAGAIALENAVMIPLAILLAVVCWQIAVTGLAFVWAGNATSAAARAYATGGTSATATTAARNSVPSAFQGGIAVAVPAAHKIAVTVPIPMTFAGVVGLPTTVTTTRSVVSEP